MKVLPPTYRPTRGDLLRLVEAHKLKGLEAQSFEAIRSMVLGLRRHHRNMPDELALYEAEALRRLKASVAA